MPGDGQPTDDPAPRDPRPSTERGERRSGGYARASCHDDCRASDRRALEFRS
jgi:hypothetical protein